MNELVERRAARAGTEAAVARVTFGTIMDFRCKEGPAGKVQSLNGTRAGAQDDVERTLSTRWAFADSHQAPSYC
ncbi:MAG: hypothetical protein BGN91_08830 [Nitrobacter sp. 62-13]|uniref:hypothetical protein n=1 Tax=Nitrobacter sp. 62-13 TaxID=1895797 RepID=UPI0009648A49|nr:hypothetical protein [Nitrobacter sp. 62-13]OJU27215.1 MAG: hypothetical protein BGN91_08830 [Nitrobacter sp. 62-13]